MISFSKHSGIYTLETNQELKVSLEEAWEYFSSPTNLSKITPPKMGFVTTSKICRSVYQGQIITYKVTPLFLFTINWVTEITVVKKHQFFIDEQRFGPYSMWHHEHFFEELPNGNTLIRDKVSYKIPFGFFGRIAQRLFIKKQLKHIFNYRFKTLNLHFNER